MATVAVGAGPMGLAVNSVTNRIYVPNNGAGANGTTVSVIDGATNTVIATIAGMTGPRYVAINEATDTIFVAGNGGTTVKVIDGPSNTIVDSITLPSTPTGVAVNPTTNRVYVTYGGAAGKVAVYNGLTRALVDHRYRRCDAVGGRCERRHEHDLFHELRLEHRVGHRWRDEYRQCHDPNGQLADRGEGRPRSEPDLRDGVPLGQHRRHRRREPDGCRQSLVWSGGQRADGPRREPGHPPDLRRRLHAVKGSGRSRTACR